MEQKYTVQDKTKKKPKPNNTTKKTNKKNNHTTKKTNPHQQMLPDTL